MTKLTCWVTIILFSGLFPYDSYGFRSEDSICSDYLKINDFSRWGADSLILHITEMMRSGDSHFNCLLPIYRHKYVGKGKEKTSQYYYNALANYYFRQRKTDSARHFLSFSLDCDSILKDSFLLGVDISLSGSLALWEEDYDQAIVHFNKALTLIDPEKKKTNVRAILNNLGVAYLKKGYLETAMAYFTKVYELTDDHSNSYAEEARNILKVNMGVILRKQKKFRQSLEIFKEVKDSSISKGLYYPEFLSLVNLGHTYLSMDSLDQAEKYLLLANKLARQHNLDQEFVLLKLAENSLKKNERNQLFQYLDTLKQAYIISQLEPEYDYFFLLGQAALQAGALSEGQFYFEKAYALTRADSFSTERIEVSRELIDIYERKGQLKQALELMKQNQREKEIFQEKNNATTMADMAARYELDRYQILLSQVRIDKELLLQKNRSHRQLLVFACLTLVSLSLIFWLYYRNTQIRRQASESEKRRLREKEIRQEKEISWHKKQLLQKRLQTAKLQKSVLDLVSKNAGNERMLLRKLHLTFSDSSLNQRPIHEEFALHFPNFTRQLLTQHPGLTTRQLEYCMLIGFGLANKEIADILYVTESTVEKSRSRLIKIFKISDTLSLGSSLRNLLLESYIPPGKPGIYQS